MSLTEAHTHQLEDSSYLPPFVKAGHVMSNNEQAKEARSTVTRFFAHSLCRKGWARSWTWRIWRMQTQLPILKTAESATLAHERIVMPVCGGVVYCSCECQKIAWKPQHKAKCRRIQTDANRIMRELHASKQD
jgi:hypothetical protein